MTSWTWKEEKAWLTTFAGRVRFIYKLGFIFRIERGCPGIQLGPRNTTQKEHIICTYVPRTCYGNVLCITLNV